MTGPYDDIIDLPHHTSSKHPRMSRIDRAAQFSPFAALSGHDAAIAETARLTSQRIELAEDSENALDKKLQNLSEIIIYQPQVSITYFVPDSRKTGGAYQSVTGIVKRVDTIKRCIVLDNKAEIPLDEIIDLSCELFKSDI